MSIAEFQVYDPKSEGNKFGTISFKFEVYRKEIDKLKTPNMKTKSLRNVRNSNRRFNQTSRCEKPAPVEQRSSRQQA